MLPLVLCLLLQLVASKSIKDSSQGTCLMKNKRMYNLLSTLTPYDTVRGKITDFKGCKAEAIWGFVRHGTRYPKPQVMERLANKTVLRDAILQNHAESRGELCAEDLAALQKWHLVADPSQDMMLTTSGVEELRQLGARISDAFPEIFEDAEDEDIEIKMTSRLRTRQSAEALGLGLFQSHMKFFNFAIDEKLIKNEKKCDAWKLSTKNPKVKEETAKFGNSTEMKALIKRVSKRLGFENDLAFEEIKDLYEVCGYEYSWYHSNRHSPWCTAFSEEDFKLMEYLEDLSYYYKSGYGNAFVPKLGCDLVKDMEQKLAGNGPKATFLIAHSSGIRKLLVSLGIGKMEPLKGDGYSTSANREWRTSYLTPFSANVMAVLYKCKKESLGIKEKQRVAIFVNEKLVPLEACGKKKMCGLQEFIDSFSALTDPEYCNKEFCQLSPPS